MKQTSSKQTHKFTLLFSSLVAGLLASPAAQSQTPTAQDIQTQELQRAADRAKAVQEQQPKAPEIREQPAASKATPLALPANETPSFQIKHIQLIGESAPQFQFALSRALNQLGLRQIQSQTGETLIVSDAHYAATGHPDNLIIGIPLGANGVNTIMTAAQNAVIDKGYTTTRILAEPQDLTSGTLKLTVMPGRVRHIVFDQTNAATTNVDRARSFNAVPIQEGDILNLRNIEQGLENFKRVPTVEADIKVAPADKPNESDLIITWAQKKIPFRGNLTLDDTGGRSTGKYLGGATVSFDNPFTLNDLFYFTYGRDATGYDKVNTTDANNNITGTEHGGNHNWNLHYSVPYQNWLLAFNASAYNYHQAVAGANETYNYSGNSRTQDIKLSRMMYRDAHRKITVSLKGWSRYSDNFIDDAEITVQRRKTAGWELGLAHKEYIGKGTLDLGVNYKRGTGAQDALHAPEELFNEGTSRMKVLTADVSYNLPFKAINHDFSFNSSTHLQWNKSPLTAQDKIAIGGRSTVRGFDGEMSLSAERGWYTRNELAMTYAKSHQVYLGLDAGHVAGPSAGLLLGQTLIGSALGVRGQFKVWGDDFSYDAFMGTAIKKPEGFRTAKYTGGFNLSYSF